MTLISQETYDKTVKRLGDLVTTVFTDYDVKQDRKGLPVVRKLLVDNYNFFVDDGTRMIKVLLVNYGKTLEFTMEFKGEYRPFIGMFLTPTSNKIFRDEFLLELRNRKMYHTYFFFKDRSVESLQNHKSIRASLDELMELTDEFVDYQITDAKELRLYFKLEYSTQKIYIDLPEVNIGEDK